MGYPYGPLQPPPVGYSSNMREYSAVDRPSRNEQRYAQEQPSRVKSSSRSYVERARDQPNRERLPNGDYIEREIVRKEYLEYPDGRVVEIPGGSYQDRGGSPQRMRRMDPGTLPPQEYIQERRSRSYDGMLDGVDRYDRYPPGSSVAADRRAPRSEYDQRMYSRHMLGDRNGLGYTENGVPSFIDRLDDKYQVVSRKLSDLPPPSRQPPLPPLPPELPPRRYMTNNLYMSVPDERIKRPTTFVYPPGYWHRHNIPFS